MKILLTGGAGFIGSHTLIELTEAGHEAVVVDNLDNSSPISLKRVAKIIGKDVPFYKVDIRDREGLQKVFDEHKFDACIHFAGSPYTVALEEKMMFLQPFLRITSTSTKVPFMLFS